MLRSSCFEVLLGGINYFSHDFLGQFCDVDDNEYCVMTGYTQNIP